MLCRSARRIVRSVLNHMRVGRLEIIESGDRRGARHDVDRGTDVRGERVDEAGLADAGLADDENVERCGCCAGRIGRVRRHVGQIGAQAAAVEVDRGLADLADVGARSPD